MSASKAAALDQPLSVQPGEAQRQRGRAHVEHPEHRQARARAAARARSARGAAAARAQRGAGGRRCAPPRARCPCTRRRGTPAPAPTAPSPGAAGRRAPARSAARAGPSSPCGCAARRAGCRGRSAPACTVLAGQRGGRLHLEEAAQPGVRHLHVARGAGRLRARAAPVGLQRQRHVGAQPVHAWRSAPGHVQEGGAVRGLAARRRGSLSKARRA